jgi:RNA polymerase sigma factor (sigma-70 family)
MPSAVVSVSAVYRIVVQGSRFCQCLPRLRRHTDCRFAVRVAQATATPSDQVVPAVCRQAAERSRLLRRRESIPTRPAHTHRILGQSSRRAKDRTRRAQVGGVAVAPLRPAVGVGFSSVPQVACPASSPRRQQQSPLLSRSALRAPDVLVLEHLLLADAIAYATARRLFPLVEREDLIQVAREALVRSAPRCRAGEPAGPSLRRCIAGALQHHLRGRVRLVCISRREHEKGTWPLGHTSLDAPAAGELSLLEQLAAPAIEPTLEASLTRPALEQLVEQLPAAQATALRLTVLEGLSLRAAAARLQISPMAVQRAQKKALAALRQQLVGAG